MAAQIVLDSRALANLLRSPQGPVMRHAIVVAERVKQHAIGSIHSDFPKRFVAPKVVKRIGTDGRGGYVLVGASNIKTEPHPIDPVRAPALVFYWGPPKGPGRVMFLQHVDHPGSDFGPYLAKKLLAAIAAVRV